MGNLVKAELFKLKRNRTFWSLFMISFILGLGFSIVLLISLIKGLELNFADGSLVAEKSHQNSDVTGKLIFQSTMLKNLPLLTLVMSIFAGFFISNEYTFGGFKNLIISGNSRSHIYFAKLFAFSLGLVAVILIFPAITTISGTILFGFGEIFHGSAHWYLLRATVLYSINLAALASIIMLLAAVLEDSGKAIILFSIVLLLVFAFILNYLEQNRLASLIYKYSVFSQISFSLKEQLTNWEVYKSILSAVLTFVVTAWLGNRIFLKKEIK